MIRFDGTEDGGLLHLLGEVAPEDVSVGMRVEPVWAPADERTGSVRDIRHFRPVAASGPAETPAAQPAEVEPGVRRWSGEMPVRHRYTPGVAGLAFAEALRDRGMLLGARCEPCSLTYVPARAFCERCFSALSADTEVGPGGSLVSWTVARLDVAGEPLDPARILGLVRLDGADTVLFHDLVELDGREPEAGMRVEAVARPPAERTGSILDLAGFRPST